MALSSRRKKAVVSAGKRSTAPGGESEASKRLSCRHAGKCKANKLASLGDSFEAANRCPAPGAWSALSPAIPSVTGEIAAVGSQQLGSPEGGVMYAAVLAGPVAPFQPSRSLKPTAKCSDLSEPAVSPMTATRCMSGDMSGPLSDKPDGTTPHAQLTNTCLPP